MRRAAALAIALAGAACSHPAPDATPDGAVRLWLDRMEASDEDPRAIKEAYALLGPTAQANLKERAERTHQLVGHAVQPWEMLADGRFGLKFRPKGMVARVHGDDASVDVTGDDPATERATVRCVREAAPAGWRVEPDLPPVPPLPQRGPDPLPSRDDRR